MYTSGGRAEQCGNSSAPCKWGGGGGGATSTPGASTGGSEE